MHLLLLAAAPFVAPSAAEQTPTARSSSSSGTTTATVVKRCPSNIPVHHQSCTLDLSSGETAEFFCFYPQPQHFPETVFTWDGEESRVADVFGGATEIKQTATKHVYRITVDKDAKAAAAGITCSQTSRTPSKPTNTPLTLEEAKQVQIHSLVIRVNGGPAYARETATQNSAWHAAAAAAATTAAAAPFTLLLLAASLAFTL